jgi:hypothetical protein
MGIVFSISMVLLINRNARDKQKNIETLLSEPIITKSQLLEHNPYEKLDDKSST